jgi:hypothetical protein
LHCCYDTDTKNQIHSADELVLTELVLENVLADYTPEEIVALLSAFVFQEKTDVEPTLTASLTRGVAAIVKISEKVNEIQTLHQVILSADDSNDFVSKPRFGMVEVVYEWARGMSFNRITDLTDVMEGTIVRVITRLDETCREVKNAARIIGDPTLFQKMGTCQELIKRYSPQSGDWLRQFETALGSWLTFYTGIFAIVQACTCSCGPVSNSPGYLVGVVGRVSNCSRFGTTAHSHLRLRQTVGRMEAK